MSDEQHKPTAKKRRQTIIPLFSLLLGIVLAGYLLLVAGNVYLLDIGTRFKQRVQNQEDRQVISEWIVNDLKEVESGFFQMATTIHPLAQQLCRQKMEAKIDEIRTLLAVIEKGGDYARTIPLNLPAIDAITTSISYVPIGHQLYNLEIISLRPKLQEFEQQINKLAGQLEQRYLYMLADKQPERLQTIDSIKTLLKDFAPFFARVTEDANQLLYNSNKRLKEVEIYSEKWHRHYHRQAIIFIALVVISVLVISFFLLRKAVIINRRLRDEIVSRRQLEKELREHQKKLEKTVQERTWELEQDIAARKQVEQQLRQTSRELEAIFANSQVGIILLKGERVLARGNRRLAQIFGYDSVDEMIGMSSRQLHLSQQNFEEFGARFYDQMVAGEQLHVEYQLKKKNGEPVWCLLSGKALDPSPNPDLAAGVLWVIGDITASKQAADERERLIGELEQSLREVKTLSGLLPICASCKKIRDDQGYWNRIESYLEQRTQAEFTHGICPECTKKLYPELYDSDDDAENGDHGK
ncbi:MAG: PAS domain S-box protein [Deltaproteobacteria bacterium]|nr:PAS domain S-box protein [Candidatus Anaeroferrophillus wilburensis]MBN2888580.1 PAS domain S-box protein [Deltaproteobacteria bacterium]